MLDNNYENIDNINDNNGKRKKSIYCLKFLLPLIILLIIYKLIITINDRNHLKTTYSNIPLETYSHKIFINHISIYNTNKMHCVGSYCYYSPNKIICDKLLSMWKCESNIVDGYDLNIKKIECKDDIDDPRHGCELYYSINGSADISKYDLIIILLLLILIFLFNIVFVHQLN